MSTSEKRNGAARKYVPTVVALCILQTVFVVLMTLCASIPRSAIEENVKKSADYYSNKYMFQQIIRGENSTVVHNYADLAWLNIAWFQDSGAPFTSALNATFYEGEGLYKNESLIKAVYENAAPDKSYSRYWHGALVLVKPLLMLTDITGIRKINAVVCALLAIAQGVMLARKKLYAPLTGYAASLVLCFAYIVPLCMEYMPAFVIMHIAGIIVLICGEKANRGTLYVFFASVGAIICFFDFLTNEILTLFVPLIFLFCIKDKNKPADKLRPMVCEAAAYCTMWFVGYAVTWATKWLLCLAVLGKGAFTEAIFDGAHRMAGAVPGLEQNRLIGATVKNINRMLPFNFLKNEADVWLAAFATAFILFCVFFLYRKENVPKTVQLLLLIACAPYARYTVLSNHSCLHPVFTFRTQMITVTALCAAFGKGIDFDAVFKRRKQCKKKN